MKKPNLYQMFLMNDLLRTDHVYRDNIIPGPSTFLFSTIIKVHHRYFSSENNENNNNKSSSSWNISSLSLGGGEESIESLFLFNAIQQQFPNDDGVFALSGQDEKENNEKKQQEEENTRLLDEEAKSLSDVLD
nr:hypothetical protein [Tanacetum cinerariifolium]